MSAGPAVSATTLVQVDVVVPSPAAGPTPEGTGPAHPAGSFTDILSAQRAESSHDQEIHRDADGKSESQSGNAPSPKSAPAKAGAPSSQSDPVQAPVVLSAESPTRPRVSQSSPPATATSVPAAENSTSPASATPLVASTVRDGDVAASTERLGLQSAAGSPTTSDGGPDVVAAAFAQEAPTAASGADVAPGRSAADAASSTQTVLNTAAAHLAATVPGAVGADPTDGTPPAPGPTAAGADRAAGSVAGTHLVAGPPISGTPPGAGSDATAASDAAASSDAVVGTTSSPAISVPPVGVAVPGTASGSFLHAATGSQVHDGTPAPSGATAARSSSAPATPSTGSGSSSAASPLQRLESDSTTASFANSVTPRVAGSPIHAVGATAPSTASIAQQVASSLDVDDLAGSISRPLSDGNGTYTVTVALHPAELGHVQAVMSLSGNDLQVSLTAQTQVGHDALSNTADALRDQLARGGVNVNVTMRDPGSQGGGDERYRPPAAPGGTGSFGVDSAASEAPISSGLASSQIHLVL